MWRKAAAANMCQTWMGRLAKGIGARRQEGLIYAQHWTDVSVIMTKQLLVTITAMLITL
jgi:hypothetical protein